MNDDLAIMDLKDIKDYLIECHYNVEAIDYAIKALEERPKGKWIYENYGNLVYSTCSNCTYHSHYGDFPFCPNCGADMRVKDDLTNSV